MSILLSLSPFAVFFVLMRLHSPIAGLTGALAASLLLCARMRWRGAGRCGCVRWRTSRSSCSRRGTRSVG